MSKMVYREFSDANGEKMEIVDFKIVAAPKDPCHMIVHKLKKTLDNGEDVYFYKATRFFRLVRVGKNESENKELLQEHSDIIRGLYQANVSYCQVVCNILNAGEDAAFGLLFYYGVQSVESTEDAAIRNCERDFEALLRSFQGTHRTAHIQNPTYEEVFWMFKKLRGEQYVTVVKGIPAPKLSSAQSKNVLKTTTSTSEQLEQFLSGLASKEFMMLLMCTPIPQKTLRDWLTASMKDQTKWESMKQGNTSFNASLSVPMTMSLSGGTSSGLSSSAGQSASHSVGQSTGTSHSTSDGTSQSVGTSSSTSSGTSFSSGTSDSRGDSSSQSISSSTSNGSGSNIGWSGGGSLFGLQVSMSGGFNESHSSSDGTSMSTGTSSSHGTSKSSGTSSSSSSGTSTSNGTSHSTSDGTSSGTSSSDSAGTSANSGASSGSTSGWGRSMGLGPSVGFSKSYQFTDVTVAYICELLTAQNQRLKNMTEGEGGFYADLYIACEDEATQGGIQSLITTTWVNPDAKIDVIRGVVPSAIDQKKLSIHMQALSPCLEMASNKVGRYYKWASILESSEIAAYSHPPRISIGGLDAAMEDIPKMRVPTDRQTKEIYIGHCVNGDCFNLEYAAKNHGDGYVTDFKFSIGSDELHHAFISGQSGSGKTVLAMRMITGLYNKCRTVDRLTGEKHRKRILVLDPKGEWRMLGNVIPRGKFRFWSLNDPHFHPLQMNLLRVPKYVRASDYYNMAVEMFCSAYGLLDRAVAQIGSIIYDLYDKKGAFDNDLDPTYANKVTGDITFEDVYDKLVEAKDVSLAKRDSHDVEAITTYLTRLDAYKKPKSKEYIMFCARGGKSVDEVLGSDDVTVIESNGLGKAPQAFFFTLVMTTIFKYAQGVKGFYQKGQYETFIVLEEANTVLIGSGDKADDTGYLGIKRIEEVIDQSRSFGLFIWTLTQKIASMPDSIIANSGLVFAGKTGSEKDIDVVMTAIGRDAKRFDVDVYKFFPHMPVGDFIAKISRSQSIEDQEPCIVKVDPLKVETPNDDELNVILEENDLARIEQKREDSDD
jgi:hypothetical protein